MKRNTKRSRSKSTRARATNTANAKSTAALLALAELLAPKSAVVAKRLGLAVDDPEAYAKKYAEELADRFADDSPIDPWLELVSALTADRVDLACSLDWKFAAEDIAGNLARAISAQAKLRKNTKLYDAKKLFAFYDEDAHLFTKTIDFIELCGAAFSAYGLALVELDISSDSYELTVLPWKDLPLAQKLAKAAGGALIHHGPKKPRSTPLASPPPKPKSSLKLEKRKFHWLVRNENFVQLPGFLHSKEGKHVVVSLYDCRVWPPKKTRIAGTGSLAVVISETDGSRIVYRVYHAIDEKDDFEPRPLGTLRIERPKKPAANILDLLPDHFDVERVAWVGDLAVIFPTEPTVRGKTARRPLVWNGKKLTPAKGLPDATAKKGTRSDPWPSFLRMGHARTGDGVDVLIWEGAGWLARGETFVKTWKLHPDLSSDEPVIGAAAPGNGFFYVHRPSSRDRRINTIRHAEIGGCRERARIRHIIDGPLRAVFDGRVLFGLNRYGDSKSPVLGIFHPATDEVTFVPPHVLGFRKDDQVDAYGVAVAKKGKAAHLWVLDDEELRRVSWDAILELPRVPAAPSARS